MYQDRGDGARRDAPAIGTTSTAPLLTVVVPCLNEAGNVEAMVRRLRTALDGIAWDVVFVDDDSPDGTAAIAKAIAATDARVRCIRRVGRRGLASACVEGMLSSAARFVAVIDGDGQHDVRLLPRMLEALMHGQADLAIASRHVAGGDGADGLRGIRRGISGSGAALARALLPVPVADPMSGYFMLPRALVEAAAPRLTMTGFKILLDILLSADRPLRVVELPYRFRARQAGVSKLDLLTLFEYLGLLLDKALGGRVPLRFIAFAAVGAAGILVHLVVLALAHGGLGLRFGLAQGLATAVAMTANFAINNVVTYRDRRLRGAALLRGLVLFTLVCSIGGLANLGIARLLFEQDGLAWGLAGAAGALLTVVWNYSVSTTLVWPRAR